MARPGSIIVSIEYGSILLILDLGSNHLYQIVDFVGRYNAFFLKIDADASTKFGTGHGSEQCDCGCSQSGAENECQ